VLVKETSLLLVPAVLWQYWQVSDRRTRRYSLILAGSLFDLVGAAYLLYATLRGEFLPGTGHVSLVDASRFQLTERAPSGSPLDPDSLSRRTLELWLGQDPGCWAPLWCWSQPGWPSAGSARSPPPWPPWSSAPGICQSRKGGAPQRTRTLGPILVAVPSP
jgi:hypothetical protein